MYRRGVARVVRIKESSDVYHVSRQLSPRLSMNQDRVEQTTMMFGPAASELAFFFSPGRCFLTFTDCTPATGKQTSAYRTCSAPMTGRYFDMAETGSATRLLKAAVNIVTRSPGLANRTACAIGAELTRIGCSGELSSAGFADLLAFAIEEDIVTGSTNGIVDSLNSSSTASAGSGGKR